MSVEALDQIDWERPWLACWREPGLPVAQAVAAGAALPGDALNRIQPVPPCMAGGALVAQALNAAPQAARAGIHFVPPSARPPGMGYEHYMFETGQCPTRDNLHDFFNGLCWLRFPRTKKRINQLHAAELERAAASAGAGTPPARGPVRDALTVFDENAAFLIAPPPLWDALEAHDWQRLFIELRPLWQEARLVLFGHALLEKLVCPRKPITAHVYGARPEADSMEALDAWVAADLSAAKLAAKPFIPLPVLGVPLWWPANETLSFYDDPAVFRLPRR